MQRRVAAGGERCVPVEPAGVLAAVGHPAGHRQRADHDEENEYQKDSHGTILRC